MKPEDVMIRPYREEDRERLKELTVASFVRASIDKNIEDRFGKLGETDWRVRKARHIDDDVAANAEGVLVAEYHGVVIGYITIVLNEESKLGRIPNMAVDAEYRGLGLGRKLLAASDDYMRAHGMKHAKIETLAQNEIGMHLYPSTGYEEVARQVHFVKEL